MFMNRLLKNLRTHQEAKLIYPNQGFYYDLSWFIKFFVFNGIVQFRDNPLSHVAFVDATLTGIEGVLGNRVYATNIHEVLLGKASITKYDMYNMVVVLKLWMHGLIRQCVFIVTTFVIKG